ncbi:MAG TPA: type IX secretion system sortase PorU, partial [Ignavibacteriaceae bacterium]
MTGKFSLIIISLFTASLFAQSEVRVISSDRNSITIEYAPVYSDSSTVKIENQDYFNIRIKGGTVSEADNWGTPAIPTVTFNIGVPSEFGNTVEILGTSEKSIKGMIVPVPNYVKKGISPSPEYLISPAYNDYKAVTEIVTFADFGYIRNLPVQSIKINPVKFEPVSQTIVLYKTIRFRINFSRNQKIAKQPSDDFAASSIINFNVAKYWVHERKSQSLKKTIINSVLAAGSWVKFEAPEEGIYKITYSMLSSYGIDPSTVDPRTIKIYNNGGAPLPENPTVPRPADLVENAIIVTGESDGKFDQGDYILFYGRGNNFWDYDTTSHSFKRIFNIYTDHNIYWITSGGTAGKRTTDKSSLNQTDVFSQTSSKAFISRDDDKINILNSGRQFLGDEFTSVVTSRTYTNKLDGRIDGIPIEYHLKFVTASPNPTVIDVAENGATIWHRNMPTGVSEFIDATAYSTTVYFNQPLTDNRSNLRFAFTPNSQSAKGYLDYFEILYEKELKAFNDFLLFFSKDTTAVIDYHLTGFTNSNIKVYDVSDYSGMKQVTNFTMISGGECRFQSLEQQGRVSRYIAIAGDNYKTPVNPIAAENSDIHGISDGAKFIIITHKNFMEAANRLKNYRENQAKSRISTIVVDIDQIFNEFAGGLPDISGIRDFIKYAFDNWQTAPEYVLFLGSGNFDYKDIQGYHTNFLPTYETIESFDEIDSWTSDDYFVNLDDNQKVDLATGRITCKTLESANQAVDKIIFYENDSEKGLWRNLITLVADDGYQGANYQGNDFTRSSETLANTYVPASYNFNKLYMAAYPIVLTGNGKRIPAGNKAILSAMNEGTLIVNYVGHGAPYVWADEFIFEQGVSIPLLQNDKYFFLLAATCDFGYFDDPAFVSAAEELVLRNNAGAIASLSSTRPVFQGYNESLMDSFFSQLMKPGTDSTRGVAIGKAMFQTKQTLTDENSRKFFLFGDPTLRLLDPQYGAVIDSINGHPVTDGLQIK